MAGYLRAQGIRLFDYAQFAQPLHEEIRLKAEAIAQAHQLKIEFAPLAYFALLAYLASIRAMR